VEGLSRISNRQVINR